MTLSYSQDNSPSRGDSPALAAHQKNLVVALTRLQERSQIAEHFSSGPATSNDDTTEAFFGFAIGTKNFVVSSNSFCEVFVDTPIAALPNAPDYLLGLCNIRGLLLPVYQLHTALATPFLKKTIIFSIGKGDQAVGLLVDTLPVSLGLKKSERVSEPQGLHPLVKNLAADMYFSEGHSLVALDAARLGDQLMKLQSHRDAVLTPVREMPQPV